MRLGGGGQSRASAAAASGKLLWRLKKSFSRERLIAPRAPLKGWRQGENALFSGDSGRFGYRTEELIGAGTRGFCVVMVSGLRRCQLISGVLALPGRALSWCNWGIRRSSCVGCVKALLVGSLRVTIVPVKVLNRNVSSVE